MSTSPLATDTSRILEGAACVLASGVFFALAGAAVKVAADSVPLETIVFFRNLLAMAVFAPWPAAVGIRGLATPHWRLHVARTAAGLGAMYCSYFAIAHIPLADAVLLNFSGPVFTPLIALAWFGLALDRRLLFALGIGFAGVAPIVRSEGAIVDPAAAVGLAAGFLGAVSVVAIWRMGAGEPAARIVFFYTAGATALSAAPMALRWQWPDSGGVWLALAACGVLSALAHLLLARGCTIAPADRTNALSYAAVVFAALVGWAAWGERPGPELLAGTLLIAAAATLVTRRQKARPA